MATSNLPAAAKLKSIVAFPLSRETGPSKTPPFADKILTVPVGKGPVVVGGLTVTT